METKLHSFIRNFNLKQLKSCFFEEKKSTNADLFKLGNTKEGDKDINCELKSLKLNQDDPIFNELQNRANLLRYEICEHIETTSQFKDISNTTTERIYKLSVTDLFVEKAIDLLDKQSKVYKYMGFIAFFIAVIFVLSGLISAGYQVNIFNVQKDHSTILNHNKEMSELYLNKFNTNKISSNDKESLITNETIIKSVISREITMAWIDSLMTFVKSFTFYGLIVLIAVILKKFGKAVIDQSERLQDKRHALRQGRLYIHLKNGKIETVEELEQAFNWNNSQNNAFADMNTEAMAPWGNVLKEVLNMFPKAIEASKK